MVKFRNGRDGRDEVRIGIFVPGGEVYFFPSRGFEQSQKWLRDAIVKKLETTSPPTVGAQLIDLTDESSQV